MLVRSIVLFYAGARSATPRVPRLFTFVASATPGGVENDAAISGVLSFGWGFLAFVLAFAGTDRDGHADLERAVSIKSLNKARPSVPRAFFFGMLFDAARCVLEACSDPEYCLYEAVWSWHACCCREKRGSPV